MKYERNFDLINRKFRELLLPTIAVSIAGNFAILIDAFLISFILGSSYLAVVQSIEPFACIVGLFYWMIGMGGSILCSIAKADFDDEKANSIFTVSLLSLIVISLIIVISVLVFHDFFTQMLCQAPELQPLVNQYLELYVIGVPFLCYMGCIAYFIKSYGFIKLQFWAFLLSNVINTICDIFFMKYLNLGITGAGLATSVGFIVSALFISYYFFSPKKSIRLIKVKISSIFGYFINICKSGYSIASSTFYEAVRLILINYLLIVVMGAVGLEAFNLCSNITFITMIFVMGTVQSIVPIVSVYFKEEDYRGVAYVCDKSMKIVIGFSLFFSILFFIFPNISLLIFNVNDPNTIPVVLNAVRLFSLSFVGMAITQLYIFYTQSVQYTMLSNVITFFKVLVLPVSFVYLFSYFWGVNGIWITFAVVEFFTIIVIFFYSRYVAKKSNNEYSGFFLIKHNNDKSVFEYTFDGNLENVSDLSKIVQKALSYSNQSETVSSAIEEMLVNIIEINDNIDLIDIIVRDKKDSMVFSVKYSGILYNPLEDTNNNKLSVLDKHVENIDYSQILELNNIEITLCRN